ncbi:hypothetical protein VTG60DRAFT_4031 [Thermothelomyces hinnuleus]
MLYKTASSAKSAGAAQDPLSDHEHTSASLPLLHSMLIWSVTRLLVRIEIRPLGIGRMRKTYHYCGYYSDGHKYSIKSAVCPKQRIQRNLGKPAFHSPSLNHAIDGFVLPLGTCERGRKPNWGRCTRFEAD